MMVVPITSMAGYWCHLVCDNGQATVSEATVSR